MHSSNSTNKMSLVVQSLLFRECIVVYHINMHNDILACRSLAPAVNVAMNSSQINSWACTNASAIFSLAAALTSASQWVNRQGFANNEVHTDAWLDCQAKRMQAFYIKCHSPCRLCCMPRGYFIPGFIIIQQNENLHPKMNRTYIPKWKLSPNPFTNTDVLSYPFHPKIHYKY